ncbi:MAG: enoyl-CoA hydratase/isomerase family protein, partial [Candidatus Dadabacteria bacterium]|nr:enoyl-CoA hydratase/isomerase family protein [Candidatus Dadabacteria bacterium]
HSAFREAESDDSVRAVVLTGSGSFFSFGFDIPGFMDYPKDAFRLFVTAFSGLVKYIFGFPKPVVAAINGHAVAGGCVLALTCDRRIMVSGKPRIALNELTLGVTIFTSIAEMLRFTVGARNAQRLLYSGKMCSAEDALAVGLVDEAPPAEEFEAAVASAASSLAAVSGDAFRTAKNLLRKRILGRIDRDDGFSILDFVDVWYEEETRKKLAKVEIRD